MTVHYFGRLLNLLILVRVILSWVGMNSRSPLTQFILSVTEPILAPIRMMIQRVFKYNGMLDFSPIVGILLVNFVTNFIVSFLR